MGDCGTAAVAKYAGAWKACPFIFNRAIRTAILELAARLVQMFSFTGDTGCTPSPPLNSQPSTIKLLCGTATTMVAALKHGRNSIGVELYTAYCKQAASPLLNENSSLLARPGFKSS